MLEWLFLAFAGEVRHPKRRAILERVEAEPGITLTRLRDAVGCSWGTIQHHTRALERAGRLRSEPQGRSRRFFLGATTQEERRGLALLRRGRVSELVHAIHDRPGCMQRDLTEGLGLTRKVLRSYVDDLVAEGLVVERRHPRARTYHATGDLAVLLSRLDEPVEPVDPSAQDAPLTMDA